MKCWICDDPAAHAELWGDTVRAWCVEHVPLHTCDETCAKLLELPSGDEAAAAAGVTVNGFVCCGHEWPSSFCNHACGRAPGHDEVGGHWCGWCGNPMKGSGRDAETPADFIEVDGACAHEQTNLRPEVVPRVAKGPCGCGYSGQRAVGAEVVDQPPPVPNEHPAVWDLVVADMHERARVGRERYGTPLQPFNGRDALVDAYQESLDQSVYLRQAVEERRKLVEAARELSAAVGDVYDWIDAYNVAGGNVESRLREAQGALDEMLRRLP